MCSFVVAALKDYLMDDSTFIYELVDVVRLACLCHEDLELMLCDEAHGRMLRCLTACRMYCVDPCPSRHSEVVFSWRKLGARERHELRTVVRITETKVRNRALLELVGMTWRPSQNVLPWASE